MSATLFVVALLTLACIQCVYCEWRWNNKVAVVSGASSGIGAEIAMQLANKRMIVVAIARRKNKLQNLARKTRGKIIPAKCDLYDENQIIQTFAWIKKNLGGVDVLINNAGTFLYAPLSTGNTSDWKTMIGLNILATSILSREALKTMRKRGDDGQIININSVSGHSIQEIKGAYMYSASKYAVTAMTDGLQNELRDNGSKIKVSSISPGLVRTELVEKKEPNIDNIPHVTVSDIAEGVIYILSTRPKVRISELTIRHY